jgi:hypothetical protein
MRMILGYELMVKGLDMCNPNTSWDVILSSLVEREAFALINPEEM